MRTVRGRAENTELEPADALARIIHDGSSRARAAEGSSQNQSGSAIAAEALMNNAG
jgi:hypothetical protein